MMRSFVARGLLALAVLLPVSSAAWGGDPAVQVKVVKYAQMGEIVEQMKGKVVAVDFWMDTCIPCKREFPRLVKMSKQYPPEEFAAISVALDDPRDNKVMDRVRGFLQKQQATFTNLVLDEKPELWQEKLKFDGPPAVFVFDREGKWKKFSDPFEYGDVEKFVAELLKK